MGSIQIPEFAKDIDLLEQMQRIVRRLRFFKSFVLVALAPIQSSAETLEARLVCFIRRD
jgi:hypothetical protein